MTRKRVILLTAGALVVASAILLYVFVWKGSEPLRLTPVWEREHTLSQRTVCLWYVYPLDYSGTAGLHPAPVVGTDFTDIFIGLNGHQVWTKFPKGNLSTSPTVDSFTVSDHGRSFAFTKGAVASSDGEASTTGSESVFFTLTVTEDDTEILRSNLIAECRL